MKNRIVTISREFGSGGRTIGKLVAQKLGIPCYDAEIIQKIAQESGFSEGYIREAGEYTPAARWPTFSPTAPMVLPTRTICGISSTISSRSLPKREPVSS